VCEERKPLDTARTRRNGVGLPQGEEGAKVAKKIAQASGIGKERKLKGTAEEPS